MRASDITHVDEQGNVLIREEVARDHRPQSRCNLYAFAREIGWKALEVTCERDVTFAPHLGLRTVVSGFTDSRPPWEHY